MRTAFVSLVGRPNVGKSTLLNAIVGKKVSIVSDKPQTTRTRVRGILNRGDTQLVFVDTPGLHKATTALGERVNATALESMRDVDIVCLVIDATQPFGSGDKWVSEQLNISKAIVVLNKTDSAGSAKVLAQLASVSSLGAADYFPLSAMTGDGVEQLIAELMPKILNTQLYKAVLDANASEHGARMTAMDNATRNAGDLIAKLTINYNRTRQAVITKELIEIISGAESL